MSLHFINNCSWSVTTRKILLSVMFQSAWDLIQLIVYCIVRVLAADMECSRFNLQDSLEEILDPLIITDFKHLRLLCCDLIQSIGNLQTLLKNIFSLYSFTSKESVHSLESFVNFYWTTRGSISVYDKIHRHCSDSFKPHQT